MVTFVLPAFNEKNCEFVSLGSLMCQTNPNWRAIVFHNGINGFLRQSIKKSFPDDRIVYTESNENTGHWGTFNRMQAVKELVTTPFVIQSSIQDYYFPKTVEEILTVANDADLIYWNSINHLWLDNGILDCQLAFRRIDWGNFAIKTELFRRIGIPNYTESEGDGYFILEALKLNPVSVKIEKILTIHN